MQFYALAGVPSHSIIRLLAAEQGVAVTEAEVAAMVIAKERRYVDLIGAVQPIAEVLAIAEACRGRMPMAVASGGERWVIHRTLTSIGVLDWFDVIVGTEDTSETRNPRPRRVPGGGSGHGAPSHGRAGGSSRTAISVWRPAAVPG